MERDRAKLRANAKAPVKRQHVRLLKILHSHFIRFMLLILLGVIVGSLFVRGCGVEKSSLQGTGMFMQDIVSPNAASRGFLGLTLASFFPVAMLLCAAFLLGTSAVGYPVVLLFPVCYGMFIGASMASIYVSYGAKGLGICLLFVIPQALICSVAVILASREGFRFSRLTASVIIRGTQKDLSSAFRMYCMKFAVCFVLAIAAAMIESISVILFAKLILK